MQRPLLYHRIYNPNTKKYIVKEWKLVHCRPTSIMTPTASRTRQQEPQPPCVMIPLELGGVMKVYPNLIPKKDRDRITNEILQYHYPNSSSSSSSNHGDPQPDEPWSLLRQYKVYGGNEPRLNCLLHTHATAITPSSLQQEQPGYRYGSVTMKGRPYDEHLPFTHRLMKDMESVYRQNVLLLGGDGDNNENSTENIHRNSQLEEQNDPCVFNIGAHIVLYRDGCDSMGFHADNDQDESFIVTTILSQHYQRDVVIKPKPMIIASTANQETGTRGEIHYKLHLHEGDVYSMDGTMQEFYLHGVPKDKTIVTRMNVDDQSSSHHPSPTTSSSSFHNNSNNNQYRRLVIVFRRGKYVRYKRDSGRPMSHSDVLQQYNTNNQ